MHPSFSPSDHVARIKLAKVSLSDLDMQSLCSVQSILIKASRLGMKPCPLYLGAFLRLQYLDRPERPYLTIASFQLEADADYPTGFYLRNVENALLLRGYRVDG